MPNKDNPWLLEHFQRNAIARGLTRCRPDDLVMVSDLDEIPRGATVTQAARDIPFERNWTANLAHAALNSRVMKCLTYPKDLRWQLRKKHPYIWKFQMPTFHYYLNCKQIDPPFCFGTRLLRYRDYSSAEEIRHSGYKIVENGGWHFSYMGGVERIRQKLAAYAHQEYNQPQYTELQAMEASINRGESLFNKDWQLKFVPLDDSFPRQILEHRDRYASWIKAV
jgi:beta-1,4-mannosyl-glycoprotein beta-1,4-N-acetylglucosaminyltransferase